MLEEKEEEQTSKNQEGEGTQETPAEETSKEETEEDKEKQSLQAQKEHFRKKAEEAEQKASGLEQKLSDAGSSESMPSNAVDVAKMANKLKDYSSEEVDFIIRNAPSDKPEDIMKAADDEFVQAGISSRREKVANEQNMPAPSSPSSTSSKEKTPKEVGEMSQEEHQKYEEELRRQERGGSGF